MRNSRFASRVAIAGVALFIALLLSLHILEPQFDPATRLISEYELGRYGWMMSMAFMSLGIAVGGLLSTWSSPRSRAGSVGRWLFRGIGVAFIGAALFYPSTNPGISPLIHGICGIVVIVTFPIAASLYTSGAARGRPLQKSRRLLMATLLVWVGFISFAGSIAVLGASSRTAARSSATLRIGWQNRFMIVTYAAWIIAAATEASRLSGATDVVSRRTSRD